MPYDGESMFTKEERKDLQHDYLRILGSTQEVNTYSPPAFQEPGTGLGPLKLVTNQMDRLPFSSKSTGHWAQWETDHTCINK